MPSSCQEAIRTLLGALLTFAIYQPKDSTGQLFHAEPHESRRVKPIEDGMSEYMETEKKKSSERSIPMSRG